MHPSNAEAHFRYGVALHQQRRLAEAEAEYRQAVNLQPDHVNALANLALVCVTKGDPIEALNLAVQALQIGEDPTAKRVFVNCVKRVRITGDNGLLRQTLIRALQAPWARPSDLSRVAADLIKPTLNGTLEAAASDELLLTLLDSSLVCDVDLESLLTKCRQQLLEIALNAAVMDKSLLTLLAALSRQCFINEYIYAISPEEHELLAKAQAAVTAAATRGDDIPVQIIAAIAAYVPLHTMQIDAYWRSREWGDPINTILNQQVLEPATERLLRQQFPLLTPVHDPISLEVKAQYEQNPYPRWMKLAPIEAQTSFDAFIVGQFPHAGYQPIGDGGEFELLIAGCGTGQQAIERAKMFPKARILAVDLSLSSLAFAKRKSEELGFQNIEFAHADILELGQINKQFDVIEAVGVLHHLAKPAKGWDVLVSLLKHCGAMRIGLYSALGRSDIVAARSLIQERGYAADAAGIRKCRQEMIASGDKSGFSAVLQRRDFFSMSACRDLLFHVKEHRLSIPQIRQLVHGSRLQLLGFDLPINMHHVYQEQFPGDLAAVNLDNWAAFELERPETFRGMYQFWLQKP